VSKVMRLHLTVGYSAQFVYYRLISLGGRRCLFTWIDRLAKEATDARKLIDRHDQAVLAKAFRGELVPQDPNHEPASALLERIRAERASNPKPKRGRRAASSEA